MRRRARSHRCFLALSPAFALVLALLSPGRSEELSPELLEKMNTVFQRAGGQYQKKDYARAADSYRELVKLLPAGPDFARLRVQVHYSLAGCCSLLGREQEALESLGRAIDAGLLSLHDVERNSDFERVRKAEGYRALEARAAKKAQEAEAAQREAKRRQLEALRALDFRLEAVDGRRISRADYAGKVLIVDIWGTWCGPCLQEVPNFIELLKRHEAEGLRIVGLNAERTASDEEAAKLVRRAIERLKIPYPCALAKEEILKRVPVQAFPTTIIFGRDGTPRAVEVGARDLASLEALVKPLLAEKGAGKAAGSKP